MIHQMKFLLLALPSLAGAAHFGFAADDSTRVAWVIDTQQEWEQNTKKRVGVEITQGTAVPTAKEATLTSALKTFKKKVSSRWPCGCYF